MLNDTLQQAERLASDNRELRRKQEDAVLDTYPPPPPRPVSPPTPFVEGSYAGAVARWLRGGGEARTHARRKLCTACPDAYGRGLQRAAALGSCLYRAGVPIRGASRLARC